MTTTPAKRDEYKDFDAWRKEQIASLIRMGYPDAARAFKDLGSVQWAGWQARAALAESELAEVREQVEVRECRIIRMRAAENSLLDKVERLTEANSTLIHNHNLQLQTITELRAELERVKANIRIPRRQGKYLCITAACGNCGSLDYTDAGCLIACNVCKAQTRNYSCVKGDYTAEIEAAGNDWNAGRLEAAIDAARGVEG